MPPKTAKENPKKKRVYFRFQSEEAQDVFVAGSFNSWDPTARPLRRGDSGVWRTHVTLSPGRYEYRFVVDGLWVNDPDAPKTENDHGGENSVRIVVS